MKAWAKYKRQKRISFIKKNRSTIKNELYYGSNVSFSKLESRIKKRLQKHVNLLNHGEKGFALISGFMQGGRILDAMPNHDIILGGPYLPQVGLVGNTTGQIYLFALKALFPELSKV